ncbi:MAG: UDP-N-acetylmuramoyl-L-alanyl-D-glutamate--2,6-diaminopimelate ligase [Christensenellales bacterium]
MKLCELLKGVKIIHANIGMQREVNKIVINSKKVKQGDVFIALEESSDGHDFAKEALKKKAAVVICQKPVEGDYVLVENTRKAFAIMAANYYQNRHRDLKIITVTGTNGKTTITHIINAILKENHKTAVIGTLGAIIDNKRISTDLTTPDPLELHKIFLEAYEKGVEYVIMEASAHAIYYDKLYGIKAEIAIFTNISQDHLDFFGSMEKYADTKIGYFNSTNMKIGIINADDKYAMRILENSEGNILSYGLDNPSDVFAMDIKRVKAKTKFIINAFDEVAEISVKLLGRFNVYNVLAAVAAAKTLKVPMETICLALSGIKDVEGRFNIINNDITVIIDYAHTPDGLTNVLSAAKDLEGGKLITVFGCGGDRDKSKRPIMGQVAGAISDFCVVTSDNPRFENPNEIIKDIEKGISQVTDKYICIEDRAQAIAYAIRTAEKGDKVLIAGKGGENYIDIMGVKLEYSDKKAAKAALRSYRN